MHPAATRLRGERLTKKPAPLGIARSHQTRDQLEVHARLRLGPVDSAVLVLLEGLELQWRSRLYMTGVAGGDTRAISTPVLQEDRLDGFVVEFRVEKLLGGHGSGPNMQ